ncbi:MAG TPA: hypothetical protein VIE43_21025 [Thermoanaerobaculia bacterium]|jgi:hypothetical protein|nr:hypothetical protein [Thermoanaerobaculia bacterium]
MLGNRLFTAGLLTAGLLGTVLTPAPVDRTGNQGGPCGQSVVCRNGSTLMCHGLTNCQWKGDGIPTSPGFVQCDGVRQTCVPPSEIP